MRLPFASMAIASNPARVCSATEPPSNCGRRPSHTSRVLMGSVMVLSVVRAARLVDRNSHHRLQRHRGVGRWPTLPVTSATPCSSVSGTGGLHHDFREILVVAAPLIAGKLRERLRRLADAHFAFARKGRGRRAIQEAHVFVDGEIAARREHLRHRRQHDLEPLAARNPATSNPTRPTGRPWDRRRPTSSSAPSAPCR